jgi:hypothetical protein
VEGFSHIFEENRNSSKKKASLLRIKIHQRQKHCSFWKNQGVRKRVDYEERQRKACGDAFLG